MITFARAVTQRIVAVVTDSDEADESRQPRCDYCSLPAVCFGADLVHPKWRCPRHCRKFRQFGGTCGPDNYLHTHFHTENLTLGRVTE